MVAGWVRMLAGATGLPRGVFEAAEAFASGASGATFRRLFVRKVIPLGLERGVSGRTLLHGLRRVGLGIRTQDFYRFRRMARAVHRSRDYISRLSGSDIPDPAVAYTHDYYGVGQLQQRVKINYRDPQGRFAKKWLWADVEEGWSVDEIREHAIDEWVVGYVEESQGDRGVVYNVTLEDQRWI